MKFENKGKWLNQIQESAYKNEDKPQNSSSKAYVVADSNLHPIEYFDDVRTANEYIKDKQRKSGIKLKDLDMFIHQTKELRKLQMQRYNKTFESSQMNETRGYTVVVELGVPDNVNNRDIEDEVERLLRTSHKINVVMDVTAERK